MKLCKGYMLNISPRSPLPFITGLYIPVFLPMEIPGTAALVFLQQWSLAAGLSPCPPCPLQAALGAARALSIPWNLFQPASFCRCSCAQCLHHILTFPPFFFLVYFLQWENSVPALHNSLSLSFLFNLAVLIQYTCGSHLPSGICKRGEFSFAVSWQPPQWVVGDSDLSIFFKCISF